MGSMDAQLLFCMLSLKTASWQLLLFISSPWAIRTMTTLGVVFLSYLPAPLPETLSGNSLQLSKAVSQFSFRYSTDTASPSDQELWTDTHFLQEAKWWRYDFIFLDKQEKYVYKLGKHILVVVKKTSLVCLEHSYRRGIAEESVIVPSYFYKSDKQKFVSFIKQ